MPKNILEVDESIIKKNLYLPGTTENDELDNLLKTLETPEVPSVTFRPLPGVCIKTKTNKNEKVFINLCQTTEIPAPEDISDEEFAKILDEEQPSWCIPMSIGHERYESSKDGTPALTYDVALNTDFFQKIKGQEHFLVFTVLTVISAIEEKHEKDLDSTNYVILKNRKVTGKLHDHRVQKRAPRKPEVEKKLIEEVSVSREVPAHRIPVKNSPGEESQYLLVRQPAKGTVEKLLGFFKLPNQCSMRDVSVNVNEDRILIDALAFNYCVDICLPYYINPNKVTALLDPNLQVLRLDMVVTSSQG